ncbi:MAG: hypothetical protein IKK57_02355 [Clostridia bacterium]|nr:hypothetical protein [Clostridia bacterium]
MRKRLLLILAVLVLSVLPMLHGAARAQQGTTLLLYMIGGDLEQDSGAASADLRELLAAPLPEGLRVIVLTGGAPEWELPGVADGAVQVSEISCGQLTLLACWRDVSCGEAAVLDRFLREYAPEAGDIVLVFWGHGCPGLDGVGHDLLNGDDTLTIPEMTEVLAALPFRVTAVGFDACSMAKVEVAALLSPWTDWFIASPAPEALSGWPYRAWVKLFGGDVEQWLTALRQQTVLRWQREKEASGLTVLSLRDMEAYAQELALLFRSNGGYPGCTLAELAGEDEALTRLMEDWMNGQTLRTGVYGEVLPTALRDMPVLEGAYAQWLQRVR